MDSRYFKDAACLCHFVNIIKSIISKEGRQVMLAAHNGLLCKYWLKTTDYVTYLLYCMLQILHFSVLLHVFNSATNSMIIIEQFFHIVCCYFAPNT